MESPQDMQFLVDAIAPDPNAPPAGRQPPDGSTLRKEHIHVR